MDGTLGAAAAVVTSRLIGAELALGLPVSYATKVNVYRVLGESPPAVKLPEKAVLLQRRQVLPRSMLTLFNPGPPVSDALYCRGAEFDVGLPAEKVAVGAG